MAVDDVSIQIDKGEIYGFLGLNGAGKTTTIRMLLGMIKPSSGKIYLFGRRMGFRADVWKRVGYMVETTAAYPYLTVKENLKVFALYHGQRDGSRVETIMDQLSISRYAHTQAGELSMGNLQRLGLAKALLNSPEVLILDEPLNGLDPAGIVEMRQMMLELTHWGTTILISSHILAEISKIATRIGIIHEGRLQTELTTAHLDQSLLKKYIVDTPDNTSALVYLKEKGIRVDFNEESKLVITDKAAFENPEGISVLLVNAGFPPREIFPYKEDLESFFLRAIRHNG
jgi:ABC-2 type transport system ATP-binding protein